MIYYNLMLGLITGHLSLTRTLWMQGHVCVYVCVCVCVCVYVRMLACNLLHVVCLKP